MHRGKSFIMLALLASSCGQKPAYEMAAQDAMLYDVASEAPPSPKVPEGDSAIKISMPQIAYAYSYEYGLPAKQIADAQKAHVAACDNLGVQKCQIVSMSRSGGEQWGSAQLRLNVDASLARNFDQQLGKIVEERHGEQNSASVTAEDLSKQIVDTDARIKAKALLADRLTQLLASRNGSVADLVAAERALADVQEELDKARSWMAEMKGRVAMSAISIDYRSIPTTANSLSTPVKDALLSTGETLGTSVAALLRFLVTIAPWLVAMWLASKLYRKLGLKLPRPRWPWRRQARSTANDSSAK